MMKRSKALRALVIGSAVGLGSALGGTMGNLVLPPVVQTGSTRGKGRGGHAKPRSVWYKPVRTVSRNPKGDLAAAQAKRERKAAKLQRDTMRSHVCQGAHNVWPTKIGDNNAPVVHTSLHPFYVNRG